MKTRHFLRDRNSTLPADFSQRPGGALKKVLIALGVLVVLLGVLVFFAPQIAGGFVPGIVKSAASGSMNGNVEVSGVSLSWTGPQRVKSIRVTDSAGGDVFTGEVEASVGLLSVITGSMDFGTITLRNGRAVVVRDAQGRTNVEDLPKPSGSPSPAPASKPSPLPAGLKARVVLENFEVVYKDSTGSLPIALAPSGEIVLKDIDADGTFSAPGDLNLTLTTGPLPGGAAGASAPISLDLTATNLMDASGSLAIEKASGTLSADAEIPGALIEALAGGESGGASGGPFTVHAGLKLVDGRLTLGDPAKPVLVQGKAPRALLSQLSQGDTRVNVVDPPAFSVRADALDVPLGAMLAGGADVEKALANGAVKLAIDVAAIDAAVTLKGETNARQVHIDPISLVVDAPRLDQQINISGGTRCTMNGQPAGDIDITATASSLAAAMGKASGELNAQVSVNGMSTAIIQPFVEETGLDLAEGIGQTLNIVAKASRSGSDASSSAGDMTVNAVVQSSYLRASASAVLGAGGIRGAGDGPVARIEADRPDAILTPFLGDSGAQITGAQPAVIEVSTLDARTQKNTPVLSASTLVASLTTGSMTVIYTPPVSEYEAELAAEEGESPEPSQPITIGVSRVNVRADATPGKPVALVLDASLSHDGRPFRAQADVTVADLFIAVDQNAATVPQVGEQVNAQAMKPRGRLALTGLPAELADVALPRLSEVVREALGPTMTLTIASRDEAAAPAGAKVPPLDVALESERHQLDAVVTLDDKTIAVTDTVLTGTIQPGIIDAAARAGFLTAESLKTMPRLDGPVAHRTTVSPIRMDLPAPGSDAPPTMRPFNAVFTAQNDVRLSNLPGLDEGATLSGGVRNLVAAYQHDQQDERNTSARVRGELFEASEPGATVATIDATVVPAPGVMSWDAKIGAVDAARLDRLLKKPGYTQWALGDRFEVATTGSTDSAKHVTGGTLVIGAPRLTTTAQFALTSEDAREGAAFGLTQPLEAKWTPDARFVNEHLLKPADGSAPAVTIAGEVPISLSVRRAAVGLQDGGVMKPGVFALDATLTTPGGEFLTGDGQRIGLNATTVTVASTQNAGEIKADVVLDEPTVGGTGAQNPGKFTLNATVSNLADSSGKINAEGAVLNATGKGTLSTYLIDTLSKQNGVLVDMLGPSANVDLSASNFAMGPGASGGRLSLNATTANASAAIAGASVDGVFVVEDGANASLSRLSPEFTQRYLSTAVPLIDSFEKKAEVDRPATVRATGLRVPLGSGKEELRKLNGQVVADLGTVQFKTSGLISSLLKVIDSRTEGTLGRRIQPVTMNIVNGVVRYEQVKLPIGEFEIETTGSVNLPDENLDLVVWVPFAILADELSSVLKVSTAMPLLKDVSMIPISIKGPTSNPSKGIAFDLIGQRFADTLLGPLTDPVKMLENPEQLINDPGKAIDSLTGGILGGLLGGGKDDEEEKEPLTEEEKAEKQRKKEERERKEAEEKARKQAEKKAKEEKAAQEKEQKKKDKEGTKP